VNASVDDAVRAALAGRLIVMPTDTVYGIGTRPDDPAATSRLFDAKGRSRELELPILVASRDDAERIARFDERARSLADEFWPGALTLVLRRTEASAGWDLGGDPATIGVRVPDHRVALAVLERTGPLAVTSANRSGEPTPASCGELRKVFGAAVEIYLCQDEPLAGLASTVLDLTGDVRVLRRGAVDVGDGTLDRPRRRDEGRC
jgi:L-threonylcarbamoyladenylate synthase